MRKRLKVFSAFCALLCLAAFTACQPPEGMYTAAGQDLPELDVVPLTVWCPEESVGLMTEMVEAYTTQFSHINYEIVVEVKSEEEAAEALLADPTSAAEIFTYSSSRIAELVDASAFSLVTRNKSKLMELNSNGAVDGAKPDEWLYGYPMAVESEYLLFYDTSVLGENDLATLDDVLAAANSAGRQVYLNLEDSSVMAGFFLGTGCTLGYNKAGKLACTVGSEEGLLAYEAMAGYAPAVTGGTADAYVSGAASTFAAGIVSSEYAEAIKDTLGGDYGAAPLPGFTAGGQVYPLYSLGSYKYLGLRKMLDVDLAPYAMDLCYYLVNAENQYQRAGQLGWPATDLMVLEYADYEENATFAALTNQGAHAAPLCYVPQGYAAAAESFAAATGFAPDADAETLLAALAEQAVA